MLAYIDRHLLSGGELFAKVLHDDGLDADDHPFIDLLLSAVAVPGEFFLDTIASVFRDSALARGCMRWRGIPVDPAAITDAALLTIEAQNDDVAAPGQTRVAHELCSGIAADSRRHILEANIGHFGLFHGSVWRSSILPQLCAFIGNRQSSDA